jgi:LPS-assembly lipoprotein
MAHTTRRQLLRLVVALPATALVSACGFRLRQAPQYSFAAIRFDGVNGPVAQALAAELKAGGLAVGASPGPAGVQPVVLQVLVDQRERTVVGQTATGEVRELQLRHRWRFALRTAQGRELIDSTELLLERDIGFRETAVLPKQAEEDLLYREMRDDLVQQMVRRLAAVRVPL